MDVPEEIADQETLAGIFFTVFGSRWEEVLVGAEKPFPYHRDWRAYFAVVELAGGAEEFFLADLLAEKQTCRIFSILTG